MKISKKVLIIAIAAILLILSCGIPAKASTIVPIITLQPIITSLIPLPTPTPTTWQPTITDLIPIPQNTFEIIPLPIPLELLTKWVVVNDSEPLYYPADVVADRYRVKILDWTNGGRLNVYDIEDDTWYYLEPPASIGAMGFPCGMCEGEDGSVYIADTFKNRILKCEANGAWSVVEDSGFSEPRALVYYNDTLYVADTGNDRIRYLSDGSWEEITKVGLNSDFDSPTGVKMKYGGGMLIADGGNYRIINRQARSKAYDVITDASYISYCIRVYPDKNNDLYISSYASDTLVKYDGSDFTLLMSGGSAVGQVDSPLGVFEDGLGTVYVADMGNNRVQRNKTSESSLVDLSLDSATITGFSPSVTEYTVSYPQGKSSVDISAISTSPYADVAGDLGAQSLDYGENVFTVTVDPELGSDKVYTITVMRQSPDTPTPSQTPTPTPEASPSDTSAAGTPEASESPQDESTSTGTLPPTNPPENDVTQTSGGQTSGDISEDAESPSGNATPVWAIVLLSVMACAVVVVGGILIYMTVKSKGKNPKDEDFE